MNLYKKIYKLNLFNQIYTPIILFFYIFIFVKNNNINLSLKEIKDGQIFAAVFLFLPIFVLMVINLFFILKINEFQLKEKILFLIINFLPIVAGILMLVFNKYFTKQLKFDFNFRTISKNSWISSIFLSIMILFLIIYSILDAVVKNTTVSKIFALLFILSIFLFVFSYFILIFYSINSKITLKEKLLVYVPYLNLFLKNLKN